MSRISSRLLCLGLAAPLLLSWSVFAEADCALPEPTEQAGGWTVDEGDGDYRFMATNPDYPDLAVALEMNSPSKPRVLDWQLVPGYDGKIAILRYFSGEPGTSQLVTLVTDAVVDLRTNEEIGQAFHSQDCVPNEWTWFDDRVEIHDVEQDLTDTFAFAPVN